MAETSADRSTHTDPERADAPGDRWVTLAEASQITGTNKGTLYRQIIGRGRGIKQPIIGRNWKWEWLVKLSDALGVHPTGLGKGGPYSGPATEKSLDRLMAVLESLEAQGTSLDSILTRG